MSAPSVVVRLVFVEGNIGAGKSTYLGRVLPRVRMPPGHAVIGIPEPLEAWTAVPDATDATKTHNLFAAFYADPHRYSALFQAHVMQTRIATVVRAIAAHVAQHPATTVLWAICERSVYTDRNIFVAALVANGSMSPLEHAVYEAWWHFWPRGGLLGGLRPPDPLLSGLCPPYSLQPEQQGVRGQHAPVVYLATPAPACQMRMRQRDRTEETTVPLTYLAQLAQLHETALGNGTRGWTPDAPCLRVDAMRDFAKDDACADACASELEAFLRGLMARH